MKRPSIEGSEVHRNTGWFGISASLRASLRRLAVKTMTASMMLAGVAPAPALSQQPTQRIISYGAPLAFGMSVEQVSQALGVPLSYVRGRSGNELLLALPNVKGSALSSRSDGLYLQFRKGRLSGWKGDWGTTRP
jgi:CTP:molybdopterin cytidylyltransferase MocA